MDHIARHAHGVQPIVDGPQSTQGRPALSSCSTEAAHEVGVRCYGIFADERTPSESRQVAETGTTRRTPGRQADVRAARRCSVEGVGANTKSDGVNSRVASTYSRM